MGHKYTAETVVKRFLSGFYILCDDHLLYRVKDNTLEYTRVDRSTPSWSASFGTSGLNYDRPIEIFTEAEAMAKFFPTPKKVTVDLERIEALEKELAELKRKAV